MKNGPYEMVVAPADYPGLKYRGRYVYEHHLVWWKHTGQLVPEAHVIHHVNHDKRDNRIENLELLSRSTHASHHGSETAKPKIDKTCGWCSKTFQVAERLHRYRHRTSKTPVEHFFCSKSCSMRYQIREGIGGGIHQHASRDVPHGTVNAYGNHGCRCDACKKAKADAYKASVARRKAGTVA